MARNVGLRYVQREGPGIRRQRRGRGFLYLSHRGRPASARDLARIRALAIPPAWTEVWICPDARGHIQATGRDARGRKQYRYHARWRAVRDSAKFDHLIEFGEALTKIRRRILEDLRRPGLRRETVLAGVVRLLDLTAVRVGNDEYTRLNHSYGLATLCRRHVSIRGSKIEIVFRGKSGIRHRVELVDSRLARLLRLCKKHPGQRLFRHEEGGELHAIHAGDINEYLRRVSGREISSKDFRTWIATVAATRALNDRGPSLRKAQRKRCVAAAIQEAAELLRNTPAVCRRAYVHPAVTECYERGILCERLSRCRTPRGSVCRDPTLAPEERMVLRFLKGFYDRRPLSPSTRSSRG